MGALRSFGDLRAGCICAVHPHDGSAEEGAQGLEAEEGAVKLSARAFPGFAIAELDLPIYAIHQEKPLACSSRRVRRNSPSLESCGLQRVSATHRLPEPFHWLFQIPEL